MAGRQTPNWVGLGLLVCCAAGVSAQQPVRERITLGPLELSLGDGEARTLEVLRSRYTVTREKQDPPSNFEETWNFSNPGDEGSVMFRSGKVRFVTHLSSWPPAGLDASRAVVEVLNRMLEDGKRECVLSQPFSHPANATATTIGLTCGNTVVSIGFDGAKAFALEMLSESR